MELIGKKILVTGGHGFLGSWVVQKLIERGVSAEGLVIPDRGESDLRREDVCRNLVQGVDLVIHCAAVTGNGEFHRKNPGKIFYDNAAMALHLMEAAKDAKVAKFVGIGSATEYPVGASLPYKEEDLWNGIPEATNLPYSLAKRMMLAQGSAYAAEGSLTAIHLLPTNMYGPRDALASKYLILSLIERFREAEEKNLSEVQLFGSQNSTRDFLYVEDAAEAIIVAAEKYDSPLPVNIGSGQEVSVMDITKMIAELVGYKGSLRDSKDQTAPMTRRVLDTTRAKKDFGFEARTSLRDGLEKTIAWYNEVR